LLARLRGRRFTKMNDDDLINQVYRKIEREKVIINAANAMRQSSNPQVQASLDSQVREARKGIEYLEERMRELQLRRSGQDSARSGGPQPPAHGSALSQQRGYQDTQRDGGSRQPPRQDRAGYDTEPGDYGDPGPGGYTSNLAGGHGMMPPRAPFGPPAPGSTVPKPRANYSKLGQSTSME